MVKLCSLGLYKARKSKHMSYSAARSTFNPRRPSCLAAGERLQQKPTSEHRIVPAFVCSEPRSNAMDSELGPDWTTSQQSNCKSSTSPSTLSFAKINLHPARSVDWTRMHHHQHQQHQTPLRRRQLWHPVASS